MISLIAAMSENRVIGRDGDLPWRLPEDLKHFKETTRGSTVVMGRKTFESLDGPLPHRTNIVVTRNADYKADGVMVAGSYDDALRIAREHNRQAHVADEKRSEIFILGGQELFRQAIEHVDRMYLTIVHAKLEGDTHFPSFDTSQWRVVNERHHPADEKNAYSMTFQTLERVNPSVAGH